jgi:hypothetical protein
VAAKAKTLVKTGLGAASADEPERAPDPWFNEYRRPEIARGFKPVHEVLIKLQAHESRKRARATKDRHWLQDIITALVAELAYHYLSGSPGEGLVVQRAKKELGKRSRYQPGLITRSFTLHLPARTSNA